MTENIQHNGGGERKLDRIYKIIKIKKERQAAQAECFPLILKILLILSNFPLIFSNFTFPT